MGARKFSLASIASPSRIGCQKPQPEARSQISRACLVRQRINPGTDAHTRLPQLRSYLGKHNHERTARSWRPLRASNQALEPKDEGVHLRRAQRHFQRLLKGDDVNAVALAEGVLLYLWVP